MAAEKFSLLRTILRTIGLSDEAIEDIIDRIVAFLSPKPEKAQEEFPYALRDDFLSPAEQSFYRVLKTVVGERFVICPKVALADLFFAKTGDFRQNRVALNRIDRKHVDFLLCEPKTMRPVVGIELDDKSHDRPERKERDAFVEGAFAAANLPIMRVPVQRGYTTAELNSLLSQHLQSEPTPAGTARPETSGATTPSGTAEVREANSQTTPHCPKCGGEMILRTAKTGANQGGKFWGCSNFPRCRGVAKCDDLQRQQ
jgi:hypothetical protein